MIVRIVAAIFCDWDDRDDHMEAGLYLPYEGQCELGCADVKAYIHKTKYGWAGCDI